MALKCVASILRESLSFSLPLQVQPFVECYTVFPKLNSEFVLRISMSLETAIWSDLNVCPFRSMPLDRYAKCPTSDTPPHGV